MDSPQINADIYLNTNKSRIIQIHHELINTNEPRIKRIKKNTNVSLIKLINYKSNYLNYKSNYYRIIRNNLVF